MKQNQMKTQNKLTVHYDARPVIRSGDEMKLSGNWDIALFIGGGLCETVFCEPPRVFFDSPAPRLDRTQKVVNGATGYFSVEIGKVGTQGTLRRPARNLLSSTRAVETSLVYPFLRRDPLFTSRAVNFRHEYKHSKPIPIS
jgi:hypothetical protein